MADGDIVLKSDEIIHVVLTDAAGAGTNPTYVDLGPYRKDCAIYIAGISGDTVQLWGGSAKTKPTGVTAATGAVQIGSNITADAHMALTCPPRWIGAKVSTYSAGAITITLVGSRLR